MSDEQERPEGEEPPLPSAPAAAPAAPAGPPAAPPGPPAAPAGPPAAPGQWPPPAPLPYPGGYVPQRPVPPGGYPPQPYPGQPFPGLTYPGPVPPAVSGHWPPGYQPPGYPPGGYPAPGYPPAGYPQQWQVAGPPALPSHPHPQPREYHQILRTWTYQRWQSLVGMVLAVVGLFLVPVVLLPVYLLGLVIEGRDIADSLASFGALEELTPSALLYLNLSLGGMVLYTWGLVRVLHRLRPRWLASVRPKMRWRFFFVCLGLSFVALVASLLVGLLLPSDVDPGLGGTANAFTGTTVAFILIVLFTTPLQAAGEEYLFRGYLLQAVGSLGEKPIWKWVAIIVTATLFAVAHGVQNFPLFFDRFMFGFIAAWLVTRTGGLEAGIAMHVLNNYLAFGIAIAFGNLDETLGVSEVSWWNILVTLAQSLTYAGLVVVVARRMGLATRTTPPPLEVAAEPPGAVATV